MAPHIRSHRVPCSCFPRKVSLQLSSKQSVGGRDYAAGLEDPAAARKWKRQLSAESAECCRTRDASRRPRVV